LSIRASPWSFSNSMEYQDGQPLLGHAPAGAQRPSPKRISRPQGTVPIWFGIIFTITMEIAVLTPPVGLNLYVIQGISRGKVSVGDVIVGSLPFIGALVLLVGLMIAFPQAALWLPQQMR
ncbi:MAG: TRAP transporter large permease subunit, partial [Alkalilacustris sp.]